MSKYFKHPLSKQFREKCINMTAWAEKNGFSKELLAQISAGKVKGKRNGHSKEIIEKLRADGFTLEDVA